MSHVTAKLDELVTQLRAVSPLGSLCLDSRQVSAGDVFLACPGHDADGRDFIGDAIARGAVAVVYEAGLTALQEQALGKAPGWSISGLRNLLGELASSWWNEPSLALTVIAMTGTNGKTTTTQWLAAALNSAGIPCGVIGTLGVGGLDGHAVEGGLTTPDVVSMHRHLADLRALGATHVVLEASSIGLQQGRLDAVKVDVGVFTNLTQDHLDYHGDMQTYAQAKALLFARDELKHAVINADDQYADIMRSRCKAEVLSYGLFSTVATIKAEDVTQGSEGQGFRLVEGDEVIEVKTPFVGAYTISNLLAVASVLRALGWPLANVGSALQALPAVNGRMEPVEPIQSDSSVPRVFVDYAHTPDALANVLQALAPLARARDGRLWCVVGCGGNRDPHKRPLMARAAQKHADCVLLTSDNPRYEDPKAILQDMVQGLSSLDRVEIEVDRAVAVLGAIWQANSKDVVLLAGKGHEQYQEVAGRKYAFDDRQWARLGLLMAQKPVPVQTDSRQLAGGALFVALRGERFDGHDYLDSVHAAGAVAALVERVDESVDLPQIVLGDTLKALQTMAVAWRRRFDLPVIGITGSNGKTTTKEMTAAVCRAWVGVDQALSTTGNLNNEIGVPLTIMRLREHHRVAVIEMGMNHPGEIAQLAKIAQPTIGLVLNAQREHQEFMQTVQAVAQENGQALCALPADGVAVYPAGDIYSELWAGLAKHVQTHLTFGQSDQAAMMIQDCRLDALGSQFVLRYRQEAVDVKLPVAGLHNVFNAAAAAACAVAAGVPLQRAADALQDFVAVKGRLLVHRLPDGLTLVDDTYNANPDSVRAAIDVLTTLSAPRALVLGDMGEVGDNGPQMHTEVGRYARDKSIDYLWALGQATRDSVEAFGVDARWFESPEALCEYATSVKPASVLVKGSRFMAMERVVNRLLAIESAKSERGADHAC
ncbi:MAG: bifunctional UDP-N-acetylmuramoyl-L-alanyl-D-glutamate--2,6-diaminopimelate ligase MurE/UDP-N-acetylmuramoyl-tripeptide--D-alanyl-D-alanine ligase MurF [Burkholderiaceae bacterium]|nr:bifunctional UDP-N-acetylmuramoyl-L-alanyl-D-glutamate--2,6-diaminopimelate ligase MurE/UDP-N-acetylmuramoyl-tripeptide--D-alanyl-D-alanine ligase MurF [Burkholderiaceae bacterium]MCD8536954.1 bifunctional UDP-N-acetylmuramoyl-L-alanyl-D-glutamate--2,6-diaminopimelate ligase MurE/UDP-N-acetylmuramoyl-tripeptide--D-alanyl-D-alanine ligase MurF [Burkholderiaceae bacterium]MCD8565735.1 bifunctional UDP-N-acetylmuramoyl-L-alanyl-D-glutamate--2,6-diaminopimelate ligase MurE/UDP-N-acetylmuramoyl-tri